MKKRNESKNSSALFCLLRFPDESASLQYFDHTPFK